MEVPRASLLNPPEDPDELDLWFMVHALHEAVDASERGEVPVGAVIVHEGRILTRAGNRCEELKDPTAHAEILAITQACEALGDARLPGCELYVTLEPCFMCAGALVHARIGRVVFGTRDPKFGACGSLADLPSDTRLNHRYPVREGVYAKESSELLKDFLRARRG
jgi:tRNA(adenine34) deaminase